MIILLQQFHLPAKRLPTEASFYLRQGHVTSRYLSENRKISTIVLSKLLNKNPFSFIDKLGARSNHIIHHRLHIGPAVVHQQLYIFWYSTRKAVKSQQIIIVELRLEIAKNILND